MTDKECKKLVGKSNNSLTLIKYLGKDKNGKPRYDSLCKCGNIKKNIDYYSWKNNSVKMCNDCKSKLMSQKLKSKNMIGKRFGKLLVLEELPHNYGERIQYKCLCDCGNIIIVDGANLRRNKRPTRACRECYKLHLEGEKFGRLTVVKRDPNNNLNWLCKCDCGNPELISVTGDHLKSGHTKSCGCINKERLKLIASEKYNVCDLSNDEYGICYINETYFIFDKEDIDIIKEYRWHFSNNYVSTKINNKETYLTTLLFPELINKDLIAVFKNHDILDLRKNNIMILNHNDKALYKRIQSNNKSGVIGVNQLPNGYWRSCLVYHGENFCSTFKDFEDAVLYRLKLENKYLGELSPQKFLFEEYGIL